MRTFIKIIKIITILVTVYIILLSVREELIYRSYKKVVETMTQESHVRGIDTIKTNVIR
jgi:hypothetical protein